MVKENKMILQKPKIKTVINIILSKLQSKVVKYAKKVRNLDKNLIFKM